MGHVLKGIIVGQNNQGDNVLGSHVDFRYIDESQLYPNKGYQKALQATAESTTPIPERLYGVPDNRVDTPFSNAISDRNRIVIRTPAWLNPFYSKKDDDKNIEKYKGAKSPEYRSNVEALESEVSGGAWDWTDISNCIKRDIKGNPVPAKIYDVDKNDIISCTVNGELDLHKLLKTIPEITGDTIFVGNDLGKKIHPSIIIPFVKVQDNGINKWRMACRINLTNITYEDQEKIIVYLMNFWNVNQWALDSTGIGEGLIERLHHKKYKEYNFTQRIKGVNFREGLPIAIEKDSTGNIKYESNGEPKYIRADTKVVVSDILFDMFRKSEFILSNDHQIGVEFSTEIRRKSGQYNYTYFSTADDHIIDAFRCFGKLIYDNEFLGKFIKKEDPQKFTSVMLDIDF